jgi:hypothetical protein
LQDLQNAGVMVSLELSGRHKPEFVDSISDFKPEYIGRRAPKDVIWVTSDVGEVYSPANRWDGERGCERFTSHPSQEREGLEPQGFRVVKGGPPADMALLVPRRGKWLVFDHQI